MSDPKDKPTDTREDEINDIHQGIGGDLGKIGVEMGRLIDENRKLKDEQNTAKDDLKRANDDLKTTKDNLETAKNELRSAGDALSAAKNERKSEIENLKAQHAQEVSKLTTQIADLQTKLDAKTRENVQALEAEKQKSQKSEKDLQTEKDKTASLDVEIGSLRGQIGKLQERLKASAGQAERIKALETEARRREEEVARRKAAEAERQKTEDLKGREAAAKAADVVPKREAAKAAPPATSPTIDVELPTPALKKSKGKGLTLIMNAQVKPNEFVLKGPPERPVEQMAQIISSKTSAAKKMSPTIVAKKISPTIPTVPLGKKATIMGAPPEEPKTPAEEPKSSAEPIPRKTAAPPSEGEPAKSAAPKLGSADSAAVLVQKHTDSSDWTEGTATLERRKAEPPFVAKKVTAAQPEIPGSKGVVQGFGAVVRPPAEGDKPSTPIGMDTPPRETFGKEPVSPLLTTVWDRRAEKLSKKGKDYTGLGSPAANEGWFKLVEKARKVVDEHSGMAKELENMRREDVEKALGIKMLRRASTIKSKGKVAKYGEKEWKEHQEDKMQIYRNWKIEGTGAEKEMSYQLIHKEAETGKTDQVATVTRVVDSEKPEKAAIHINSTEGELTDDMIFLMVEQAYQVTRMTGQKKMVIADCSAETALKVSNIASKMGLEPVIEDKELQKEVEALQKPTEKPGPG